MPEALVLYRFRYRDPGTGRWMRARYRATLPDIRARYTEWTLEDDAEHRRVDGAAIGALAQPAAQPRLRRHPGGLASVPGSGPGAAGAGHRTAVIEQTRTLDVLEAALVACFLRRYVTYCARRGRYAAMNGAACLLREVAGAPG